MPSHFRHRLAFYGTKRLNFKARTADMTHFIKSDGSSAEVRLGSVEGIVFGYMVEPPIRLLVFKVQEVLLNVPVRVDWKRVLPDGKGPSPQGKRIDETPARLLLDDIISKNRSQRRLLQRYYGLIRAGSNSATV
jgi:hypothetical protein